MSEAHGLLQPRRGKMPPTGRARRSLRARRRREERGGETLAELCVDGSRVKMYASPAEIDIGEPDRDGCGFS